jgi:hypothetical protein
VIIQVLYLIPRDGRDHLFLMMVQHISNVGRMQCSDNNSMPPFIIWCPHIAVSLVWDYLLGPHAHIAVSVGHILSVKQGHINILILAVA